MHFFISEKMVSNLHYYVLLCQYYYESFIYILADLNLRSNTKLFSILYNSLCDPFQNTQPTSLVIGPKIPFIEIWEQQASGQITISITSAFDIHFNLILEIPQTIIFSHCKMGGKAKDKKP